ncbi:oligosaccharide flippase family protein [Paenibacillus larvae]|uniref:oligosaccharide flippase family protein n=1 Tax=Paenibacillus larvae TaxID=1464 RepID=UPI0016627883
MLCISPPNRPFARDSQLEFPIRCLAPALLVVPLLQLFRGFLQGIEFYGYIAASELIEQTVRVSTMLLFVLLWINYGTHAAAGGAVFGACTGLLLLYGFFGSRYTRKD